jgi:putative acetyltransferase
MMNVSLIRTNSDNPDFRTLIRELDANLRDRNGDLMDIYDQHNIIEHNTTVVIAYLNNEPAGCGCFKLYDDETVEIKRMFVREKARGNGVSKLILTELEEWARSLNFAHAVLETGAKQSEALSLYPRMGYTPTPSYGQYVNLPDSYCFKKTL